MTRTLFGFVFLFLFAASFTAGFHSVAFATDDPCGYWSQGEEYMCCWDELDRSGVWWLNEEHWPHPEGKKRLAASILMGRNREKAAGYETGGFE
jgi:hypothetical protein